MLSVRRAWILCLPYSLFLFAGCTEGDSPKTPVADHGHDHDHDHGHEFESLQQAVEELTALRNTIRDAFAKDDADTAHDPLHEVGEILEAIPGLAKKEKLSDENIAVIEKAATTLMDAFGAVDKTMHGQEGSSYSEESAKIDAAIVELTAASGIAVEPAAETTPAAEPAAEATPDSEPAAAPAAEPMPE